MPYAPYRGACLFIPYNDVPHLFVVLNDPCKDGLCLLVMASSIKQNRHHDSACLLDKGDHDFITKPTYIVYRIAYQARAVHISGLVEKGYYKIADDASDDLLQRVTQGLFVSDELTGTMDKYARSVGLDDI